MEIILETKHIKDSKVMRSGQHGFTKGKSYLTNLMSFYNQTKSQMVEEGAVYVVFTDFNKALDTVPLLAKLMKYKLDEQVVKGTENCLNSPESSSHWCTG